MRNPIDILDHEKIHESLYILHKCFFNTKLAWDAIDEHQQKGPLFKAYHFTQNLGHYIMLETYSFLDEYKRFNTAKIEEEYFDRVKTVRTICKPIIKQFEKWSGLKDFRNNIIAHPWRDSGKLVVDLDAKYIVPRSWIEIRYMKDLVSYVHNIISEEFKLEFNQALFLGDSLRSTINPVLTFEQINEDLLKIFNESKELMKMHNKEYDVRFYTYSP